MNTRPTLRSGNLEDTDWLFELFRQTMRHYIDDAWGWDELLQREGFSHSLPAKSFQILEVDSLRVGSFHLSAECDHLLLDMILVEPAMQRRGYGHQMMRAIKERSLAERKPVRLSVLKTNPAVLFHLAEGFVQEAADEFSLKMVWMAP